MPTALEQEPTLNTEGVSDAELSLMQSQIDAAREADPELFKPEAEEGDWQAAPASDEHPENKVTNDDAAAARPGTGEDTQRAESGELKVESPKPAESKPPEPPKAEELDAEGKPKSKFVKETERRDKSWKALNAEKETHTKEREAFKAEQAKFATERQEWETKIATQSEPTHTPEQFEQAAKWYEQQGKLEAAEDCRAEAKRLRENPPKVQTPRVAQEQLTNAQRESWKAAKQEIPEMFDPKHPLNAQMKAWLEEHGGSHPVMKLPEGPRLVAHQLKLKADYEAEKSVSSRVPVLETEVAKLKARNEELERLVNISGGGLPPNPAKPKRFEEMTEAEAEAHVRRRAAEEG